MLLLADHFVEHYSRLHGRSLRRISTSGIDTLMSYHWRATCASWRRRSIERMYLTAAHGVEFRLPAAGAAPLRERPEGYLWIVVVE